MYLCLPLCTTVAKICAFLIAKNCAVLFTGYNQRFTFRITKTRGGKRSDTVHEKWELITTHTARRSFATNAFKRGCLLFLS